MNILIIEDEVKTVQSIKQGLEEHQWEVDVAYDGTIVDIGYSFSHTPKSVIDFSCKKYSFIELFTASSVSTKHLNDRRIRMFLQY